MYERIRLTREQRKQSIINAGLCDADERGPYNISFITVCRNLPNCKEGTVRHYYPTLSELRDAIISEAIASNNHFVIGGAIAMKDPLTDGLSKYMRTKCMNTYLNRKDKDV